VVERNGGFSIDYEAECKAGDIRFRWSASITGAPDGTLTWRAHGKALSNFQKNRVGWCVLHPVAGLAGARCEVEHSDGGTEPGWFPRYVSPHQPFLDIRAIRHEVRPGLTAEVRFSGDTFEMEDQRNWTDASYKIYSTPLALPFPAPMRPGDSLHQIVTLRFDRMARVELAQAELPMPKVGFRLSEEVTAATVAALRPAHLRADTPAGIATAVALGFPVESALAGPGVRRLLVLDGAESPEAPAGAEIAIGTAHNFAEFNRTRPDVENADAICFSVNPGKHATDRLTMLENLPGLAAAVESARRIAPEKRVAVTVALEPSQRGTWFAAAWTIGSLKYLAESGASSITYDFPHGILAAVAEATHVVPCRSSDPLLVEAFAARTPDGLRVFVANFSSVEQRVELPRQLVSVAPHTVGAFDLT
jgi:hypothetical protein